MAKIDDKHNMMSAVVPAISGTFIRSDPTALPPLKRRADVQLFPTLFRMGGCTTIAPPDGSARLMIEEALTLLF